MSDDAVRQALATLQAGLTDWLAGEAQRGQVAREVASREGLLRELDYLRSLDRREPWQDERLRLLAAGADADRERLAELRQEQERHKALTARLRGAERTIFRFAGRHGLDAGPLPRLLVGGELGCAGEVVPLLRRVADALDPVVANKGEVQYVTLQNMADIVQRTKRCLNTYKGRADDPLPDPDWEGGGGKPDYWIWDKVRPWLERNFRPDLPKRFPSPLPPAAES
jgi:hypothetical protein